MILGLLQLGPRSGYDIKTFVDRSVRFFWAASYGQIYPELRRLHDEGLISGEDAPRGDRRRTVYRLTGDGQAALHDWLTTPGASIELRDEGLLKLFFADSLTTEEQFELVRQMRHEHETVIARLGEIAAIAQAAGGSKKLVHQYGTNLHQWSADWLADLERRLEARTE